MPRPNRTGLTPSVIESLRNQGMSFADIAREYEVSRQYVSWIKNNYSGVSETPREQSKRMFPWHVSSEFHRSSPHIRLRDHLEYMVTGGKGMSDRKLTLLRGFYARLQDEDLVVEFDPAIPASPGIYTGGWAFRPREERDGDLLIRLNEHSRDLTDEERMVWRFPPVLP